MGNTVSVPEEAEEDSTCTIKSYQALSESPDTVKNGSAVFAQNHSPAMNGEVDAKASVARDNVAVSSPKTMEQGPAAEAGGQSLGSAARRAGPAAKPRSVLAFSWAVPGRTEDPAADSSLGSAKLDVSPVSPSGNKALSEGAEVPGAAVPEEGSDKNLSRAPLQDIELTVSPEGEDVATSKPKPVTFFDRIFKLEKGKERNRARGDPQEERQVLDVPDGSIAAAGLQSTSNGVPQGKEIDDCNQKDPREDSAGVPSPSSAQAEKAEVKQDSPQAAAAGDNSVMSFLKTLVSPSKAEAKSDSEDKGSRAEKGHGGQPSPKAESPTKGAKKKKAESPKLGHSTFSKLFRHKAAKETQQTTNTKSPEQQPVTSVKPDKNVPPSQEPPPAKQNPKVPEVAAAPQGAASEAPREGMKEKPSATPMPLSKLFWKKNSSEEAEAVSNEKTEASFEAVAPDRDESKSPEGSEVKPRAAESKTPKANLRKFFKLTLNPTEKPLAPAEGDPVGQRSKESSKDKKSTVELSKQKGSKQESREQPDPREQPAADTDSIQNGGDASKEPSYKKTEKRQSLGGFFKGLGSKRTSDAEVQTDPVSILPAGKSK
ncbi:breast carcinoma-amplified sequence 1 [Myiozetetes cayanensis]|uniref:breast carcinoma-amplified sequence 1 n=1 Tax=Myiozetetes cayanensis TaxID=478635 RepID=UPI002160B7F4|nr:breast carcinoma-amplified sequence 1 [Myiozetetes cayanensis]